MTRSQIEAYRPHALLAVFAVGVAACRAGFLVPAVVAVALAVAVLTRGGQRGFALALVVAVVAGSAIGVARLSAIDHSDLTALAGRDVELRGWVVKRERARRGAALRLRATAGGVPGAEHALGELVMVRARGLDPSGVPAIGAEAVVRGELALPERRAGDDFDYPAYLRRAGIHVLVHADAVRATGRRRGGVAGIVDAVRRRAVRGVAAGLPPGLDALAAGMVLGEDEQISDGMRDDFKRSGLAHVLAVSGQNVALLALLAWPLLAVAGLGRRGRLIGTLVLIALYVPLTGAGPSIVRAGTMGAAAAVAALAGRPSSRWYALLLAAAVSHVVDPRAWQDAGWQLSFAAVAGIFAGMRPLRDRLARLPGALADGAAMTIAATVATAPLTAFHFDQVSLASLPANLAALPAIAPVMWLGMLSAAAAQVAEWPATLLNAIAAYPLAYVAAVARACGSPSAAVWVVHVPSGAALAGVYAVMVAGLVAARSTRGGEDEGGRARQAVALAAALALALAAGALAVASARLPDPPTAFTATFLDIGQGDATLLQAPGGRAVLVDGGPPGDGIAAALRRHGVRTLDVAVLTHAQEDHQGGLEEVLDRIPVRILLDGGAGSVSPLHDRIVALARARGTNVVAAAAGQRLSVEKLRLSVLSPPALPRGRRPDPEEDPNLRAVVLLATYRGLDVFLPADAESDVTGALSLPPVEVLKVAHHGSADEGLPHLLERLRPRAAVIEVGAGNRFGHPTAQALHDLSAGGAHVYRTDQDGEVTLTLGPQGPVLTSER